MHGRNNTCCHVNMRCWSFFPIEDSSFTFVMLHQAAGLDVHEHRDTAAFFGCPTGWVYTRVESLTAVCTIYVLEVWKYLNQVFLAKVACRSELDWDNCANLKGVPWYPISGSLLTYSYRLIMCIWCVQLFQIPRCSLSCSFNISPVPVRDDSTCCLAISCR